MDKAGNITIKDAIALGLKAAALIISFSFTAGIYYYKLQILETNQKMIIAYLRGDKSALLAYNNNDTTIVAEGPK